MPNLQSGVHTFYADFVSSDPRFDNSTSDPVTVGVSDDDFSMTAAPSLTVETAHHVLTPISLASLGIFADTLQFSCSNLPQYATCIFKPAQVSLTPGSTAADTLWVDTDQVIGYASNTPPPLGAPHALLAAGVLAGLYFGRRRRLHGLLLAAALTAMLASTTACSGKLPLSTPPGIYTFMLTGQGQATGISHTLPMQLTVTQ